MVKATYKQTFAAVWLRDKNYLLDLEDKTKLYLNQTFYYYRVFGNKNDLYQYITKEQLVVEIYLIISVIDSSIASFVNQIIKHSKIAKIYVFPPTNTKISGCTIVNSISDLDKHITKDIQNPITELGSSNGPTTPSNHILPPSLSVFNSASQTNTPIQHLTKESLWFLCFLRMVDILRQIQYDGNKDLEEMWLKLRELYKENQLQLDHIDELERTYDKSQTIPYYTGNSCLSRVVNQACHTENMREIFTYRVYIRDLHGEIVDRHNQVEESSLESDIEMVYRGKPLSGSVLQKLIDSPKGLILMNGFLSTTAVREVASHYHGDEQVEKIRPGYKRVLFRFKIDASVKQSYAYIGDCSTKPDEAEILFSLGTIWCIESVKIDNDLYIIDLSACDEQHLQSIEVFKEPAESKYNLMSVGDILLRLGDDDEAEWFYEKMLNQSSVDNETKCCLHWKIGDIRLKKKDNHFALKNFEKAIELCPPATDSTNQMPPPRLRFVDDKSPFTTMYINMGIICQIEKKYKQATKYYTQAVNIKNESKLAQAKAYNHLGLLYFYRGKYDLSSEYHKKALDLIDKNDVDWTEFQTNYENANQRCEHLKNEKKT